MKIQTGRADGDSRNERLCKCKKGVQSLEHVIFQGDLTTRIRNNDFNVNNLESFFANLQCAAEKLRQIDVILKIAY